MSKLKKPFQFAKPLSHKVVKESRLQVEHVGDLLIEGEACCDPSISALDNEPRYTVEIHSIKWNGHEVKDLLDCFSHELENVLIEIDEAAIQHAAKLFMFPKLSQEVAA